MSYHFRGRYTHDAAEYRRWQEEAEAQDAIASARATRAEAASLREQLSELGKQYDKDVRSAARRHARIEQQQTQYQQLLEHVARRQEDFEQETVERQDELAQDLRSEIGESEARLSNELNKAKQESTRQVAAVRQEVDAVRTDMQNGFAAIDQRVTKVKEDLEKQADVLREDLTRERNARIAKETHRAAEAAALLGWLEEGLTGLRHAEKLDLTMETVRIQEGIRSARQKLADVDRERALPLADIAFRDYQAASVESESRHGTMEGVADHVEQATSRLASIIDGEAFTQVFGDEAQRLRIAADLLQKRAAAWRTTFNWHAFKNERTDTVNAANGLVEAAVELESAIPNLVQRITERDRKIDDIAAAVTDLMGAVDSFEASFANPSDPKSPRLLRARIGHSTVDAYLHLNGGFDVEAYGFQSSGDCQRMADRMNRKLQEVWHLDAAEVSHTNPQSPALNLATSGERWQSITQEIGKLTTSIS